MQSKEEGKRNFNKLLEDRFVENFKLKSFNIDDILVEIDSEIEFGPADSWDIADFSILHKTFAPNLYEMKKDMEVAFNKELDIDELEICDYYTKFVIEYIDKTLDDYKEKCSLDSKNINKKLKDLNYVLNIDKKGYFSK